ncbi:MAG: AAA family ATPase [Bacteroidales bacterium]|nr:AAA family ATPase [Bacteroidales bacterium]
MKLKKLTIHNIASIEDAVIDFEAQPLSGSEVFLITGKTGAGKSTILDAISLALYADTPRLNGTKMQGEDKETKVKDPRQLLRRNTGEGFVTLYFEGNNAVAYEAKWAVHRAHCNATKNLQDAEWQLTNLDSDYTLLKVKDIQAEIANAVGLDFQQFCRTTMLAQGEFTRFLNSSDNEKASILEKITGVDTYSKISVKVFELCRRIQQEYDNAQALVEGTTTLSEEEVTQKNADIAAHESQLDKLKAAKNALIEIREWLKHSEELGKLLADAEKEQKEAEEAVNTDDFKTDETTVREWNETIDARKWNQDVTSASTTMQEQDAALNASAKDFAKILAGSRAVEENIKNLEAEQKKVADALDAKANEADIYDNVQTIAGHLKAMDAAQKDITKEEENINRLQHELETTHQPALDKASEEHRAKSEALKQEESALAQLENEVENKQLATLRKQKEDATTLLQNIKTAKDRISALKDAETKRAKTEKDLADKAKAIEEKKAEASAMVAPLAEAKGKMDACKEIWDKQQGTIEDRAKTLRASLKMGDTCPVCLQKITAQLPVEEELARMVGDLQADYDEKKNVYDSLNNQKMALDATIKAETDSLKQQKEEFNADKSVDIAKGKAQEACADCGLTSLDETTPQALEQLVQTTSSRKEALENQIKEGEKSEKEVTAKRKDLDNSRRRLEALKKAMEKAEKDVNDCKAEINTSRKLVATKRADKASATEQAEKFLAPIQWDCDWTLAPTAFASVLLAGAKDYSNLQKKKQDLANKFHQQKDYHDHAKEAIASILNQMPAWGNMAPAAEPFTDTLLTKANSVSTAVSSALAKKETAQALHESSKQSLDQFLAEHPQYTLDRLTALNGFSAADIKKKEEALQKKRDHKLAADAKVKNVKEQQDAHQANRPEIAEGDTIENLQERIDEGDKESNDIAQKKGAIQQELETNEKNKQKLGTLIAEAEAKKVELDKWNRLNQLIGSQDGKKFRKIAQSYVLANLIHSANYYMRTLTDRYTLKVEPGTFVISVEDAYQGYVSRSASTISGGESFLVSLSLALALSDIGSNLKVDTLFIDEGFGTLSGEPLQKAIDTLRSLHDKAGRQVGIISHVEELRERIPVQIQVNQEGHHSSSQVNVVKL